MTVHADELNENLTPIYTQELIDGAEGSLAVVGAMGQEMQERAPVLQKKHCVQYRVAMADSDAPSAEVEDGAGSGGREDV